MAMARGEATHSATLSALAEGGVIIFDGDYTGVIDEVDALETLANANPNVPIMLKPGTLNMTSRAYNPAGGQDLVLKAMVPGTTIWKYATGTSAYGTDVAREDPTTQAIYTTNQRDWQRTTNLLQVAVTSITEETAPDIEPATGTFTLTGLPNDGDTVTIGSHVYRFKNTLAAANDVKIGTTATATAANLINAINGGTGAGTAYHASTVKHYYATASGTTGAVRVDTPWGAITATEATTNGSWTTAMATYHTANTDSDRVHCLNGAAGAFVGFEVGDIIAVNSSDLHPETIESIVNGEASRMVMRVDNENGKLYLDGKLNVPIDQYTSNITATVVHADYKCEISGIVFQCDGDWNDYVIPTPSGRHIHAVDIVGYPRTHIHDCKANGTWEGFINIDLCPYSLLENNTAIKLPNLLTAGTDQSPIDYNSGHLGYAFAIGNLSCGTIVRDNNGSQCRHFLTSAHHSVTGYVTSDWYQAGCVTEVEVLNNTCSGCYGIPWDVHESAVNWSFRFNRSHWALKGPQHASYNGYHAQDRGTGNKWFNNEFVGGQYGIRIADACRYANSVTKVKDNLFENFDSSTQDTLPSKTSSSPLGANTSNRAIIIENMIRAQNGETYEKIAITNPPLVEISGNECDGVNVGLTAFGGPLTIKAGDFMVKGASYAMDIFGDVKVIVTDKHTYDFLGSTRSPSSPVACVRMTSLDGNKDARASGGEVLFLADPLILKDVAADPTSFFAEIEPTSAGTGLTLNVTSVGFESGRYGVSAVTVNAGGTGYAVGDILKIAGTIPTVGGYATVTVATLSGSAVATVTLGDGSTSVAEGFYSADPAGTGVATSPLSATHVYYVDKIKEYKDGGVTSTTLLPSDATRFAKSTEVSIITGELAIAVTGTSKTLALTDLGLIQECSNASTQTFTIPLEATVAWPDGAYIPFEQLGAGTVKLVGATGVTILCSAAGGGTEAGANESRVALPSQGSSGYLRKTGTNTWLAAGFIND